MVVSSWILLKEDGSVFLAALSRALKKDERGEIGENWKKEESRDRHVKTRASYNNPIFPFLGMKKVNQFPLVGFFFWINSQKWEQKFQPIPNVGKLNSINSQSQMGTKFSTNSQWGEIKFNQFPVLLECQRKRLIQIFQSIPSSGNSCGNQFPLWE